MRKSYLLHTLYKNYLVESGINKNNIICIELDLAKSLIHYDTKNDGMMIMAYLT